MPIEAANEVRMHHLPPLMKPCVCTKLDCLLLFNPIQNEIIYLQMQLAK